MRQYSQSKNPAFYVRETVAEDVTVSQVCDKLDSGGVESLRDGELLMLILDISPRGVKDILGTTPLVELVNLSQAKLEQHIGMMHSYKLLSGIELAKRGLGMGNKVAPIISCPAEALPLLVDIKDTEKEHFVCLYLNARNGLKHKEIVSIGSLSASIVHPREVFSIAIKHTAASVILAHNHPSGDVSPSADDIELTRRLVKAGEVLGIDILDHIIVSAGDFTSLKESGLM